VSSEKNEWDLVINPKTGIFDLRLKLVWQYRDLLWLLVRRDFISFYKQTVLGPFWFLIQPLFTITFYVFIFGTLAGISTGGLPKPLFYLSGIISWTYFSDCLLKTSNVFRENAAIFGKVYFPRLIMPLSIVLSSLVKLGIQILLLAILMVYYAIKGTDFQPTYFIFLLPYLFILTGFLGLGLGLIISAVTTKYRDFAMLLSFAITLFMYACPVVYDLSVVPSNILPYIVLNPLTTVIEGIRAGLFGNVTITLNSLIYISVFTGVVLLTGIVVFNKVEKNFVDTI